MGDKKMSVGEVIVTVFSEDNVRKIWLGDKKDGRARTVYDVVKNIGTGKKGKKKKKKKGSTSYDLYLGRRKKKKKKGKRKKKNSWYLP